MDDHKVLLSIRLDLWNDLELLRIKKQKKQGSNYQKKDHLLDILEGAVDGEKETNS